LCGQHAGGNDEICRRSQKENHSSANHDRSSQPSAERNDKRTFSQFRIFSGHDIDKWLQVPVRLTTPAGSFVTRFVSSALIPAQKTTPADELRDSGRAY
jgi:hypothetical protein